jgi:hypothetical protein
MVVKSMILSFILLLNCQVFSQVDTSKVCFPYHVAKLIAIDLIKCDSMSSELNLVNDLVYQQEQKITQQDTVIEIYKRKEINYIEQLNYKDTIYTTQKQLISNLKQENTILENKRNKQRSLIKVMGGGLICTLAILITSIIYK